MKKILLAVFALTTGCAEMERREAQERADASAARWAHMRTTCQQYGFEEGTKDYSNCMFELDQQDMNRRMAAAAAIMGQPTPTMRRRPLEVTPIGPKSRTDCVPNGAGGMRCTTR